MELGMGCSQNYARDSNHQTFHESNRAGKSSGPQISTGPSHCSRKDLYL